jgi:hypothetical protein
VREGDLFPYLPEQEFNDIHTVLALRDYSSEGTWAGLMRLLSKTGADYSDYEFAEFWIDAGAAPTGTVHVELGTVSEDFYPLRAPNGTLNSEDVDRNGFDADEDTGLDNCCDTPGCGGAQSGCVPDPDDDYAYEYGSEDYTHINGTEDNDRLDTEDLNGNWYLDTENRYWSLTVDLDDDTYLIQDNSTYPDPAKRTNWRLYRIPLSNAASVGGMSDWRSVKSARFWIEGVPLTEAVLLGSLDVVGNQWEAGPIRDVRDHIVPGPELSGAAFRVAAKNTKEDLDYAPPFDPGVDQDTNLPKREQSLALLYENLGSGQSGAATRISYSDENYTDYQSLEFYVHGEADVEAGTTFFIRLGADTLNYYEYSFEVSAGWLQEVGAARNRLSMPFSGFSDLKLDPYAGADTVVVWGDTTLQSETLDRGSQERRHRGPLEPDYRGGLGRRPAARRRAQGGGLGAARDGAGEPRRSHRWQSRPSTHGWGLPHAQADAWLRPGQPLLQRDRDAERGPLRFRPRRFTAGEHHVEEIHHPTQVLHRIGCRARRRGEREAEDRDA